MQVAIPIPDSEISGMVAHSLEKVFSTMLHREVTLVSQVSQDADGQADAPIHLPLDPNSALVVGTVGFLGSVDGVIYIYMNEPLALTLTCTILGLEPADLDGEMHETVNDAVGELTNMITGTFKNMLCDQGFNCKLTIPSILRGSRLTIEPIAAAIRRLFQFETQGQALIVDLLLKPGD
ncbi:MAG: chemotaxis protein CheX [Puniceicoccaceae bacterium]|nr:MAG: chemotaxis protein CheX [Puniceicoccaceae bacterium]